MWGNICKFVLCAFLLSVSIQAFAQDHQPGPMIGEKSGGQETETYQQQIDTLRKNFTAHYNGKGRPRIAIFWNRKFDDQLSQWVMDSRKVDTRDHWWGEGFTGTERRLDVESRFDDRPFVDEVSSFEFGSGFTRTLLASGVEIVDRDSIMRLSHRKVEEAADSVVVADYQKVEMDALDEYADYLAEVLYAPSANDGTELNFLISIKEVRTGRVVSMFRSRESALPQPAGVVRWVATDSGYQKMTVPVEDPSSVLVSMGIAPGTLEHLGWTVAMQTMSALTDYWRQNPHAEFVR